MTPFNAEEVVHKLGSRLKIRHLTLLLQIRQHGSLTRVAEQMATSQPAVTNALAELESMFGVPLFDRSSRGMSPTPLGAIVLAHAQALVNDLAHLVQEMDATAAGYAGHLHIGVIPFVSSQMLSTAINHTMLQGRGITATLHENSGPALLRQLRDHTLDIVVGWASPSADLSGIRFETLSHQAPRLVANRRLAARLARVRLEWHTLADLDWILGAPDSPIREQVAMLFLRAGLPPPTPLVQSDSTKLIGEIIVANDRAVSILPNDIADEMVRIAGAAIVPYSFDWTLPPISFFMRTNSLLRHVDTLFSAALRETYARSAR